MSNEYVAHSPHAMTHEEGDWIPNPEPHRPLAGNHADDDGIAIDQMFEAMEQGPQVYGGAVPKEPNPPKVTRLLSRCLPVQGSDQGGVPVQFFPSDPNRKSLTIMVSGAAAVAYTIAESLMIGSQKTALNNTALISLATIASNALVLEGYTGALWMDAQSLAALRFITVISHTE